MGQAIAALRETLTAGDAAAKKDMVEQLTFLVHSANSKLDKYQGDLEALFMSKGDNKRGGVPGIRALRWERGYRVGVSKEATSGISDIIDGFFGDKDEKGNPNEHNILNGFKKLIGTALDVILGNANAGEQEEQKFFVFMQHNAVIRIDVKMWRYNFNGKGVMAESENVFAYIFCTSVVKHNDLEVDELMYLLSEHAGDETMEAYLTKLMSMWARVESMKANLPLSPPPPIVTPAAVLTIEPKPAEKVVVEGAKLANGVHA